MPKGEATPVSKPQSVGGEGQFSGKGPSGAISSEGGNRATFDKSGNLVRDNQVVQFAGRGGLQNNPNFRSDLFSAPPPPSTGLASPINKKGFPGIPSQPQSVGGEGQYGGFISSNKSDNFGQNKLATDQFYRGSAKEDQIKQSEANRATNIFSSGPQFGGKVEFTKGGRVEQKVDWVPPLGNHYFNMGQGILGSELNKGTVQEQNAKVEAAKKVEASKASSLFYPKQKEFGNNKIFTVGGPKYPVPNNQGGITTGKSLGKSYGSDWVNAQLGTKQNFRGNTKAEQIQITQQAKESKTSNITDVNSISSFSSGLSSLSNQQIAAKNQQIELGNGLISLSNKQIAEKNLQSEANLKSYFNQTAKEGGVIIFYTGNKDIGYKEVGQTSGARSYYDFLKARKQYTDLSYGKAYPNREKELSQAVSKNPDFYLSLSPTYWQALSEKGYYTERNAPKINSELQTHFIGKNLGLMQGNLYSERHGGEVTGLSGPLYISPPESEVANFLRVPFSGSKEYNAFTGSFGLKPTPPRTTTSAIPSTSWTNVAQFYPGLPIVDRLAGPASEVWVNILSKGGVKAGDLFTRGGIKFRNTVQEKAMENQYNFPKPQKNPSELIRPVNLKELEPVGLQIQKQTMGKRPETFIETTNRQAPRIKENLNYQPSKPSNLPTQGRGPVDINFKTNTPVFQKPVELTSNMLSPAEQANRDRYPFMTNTLPKSTEKQPSEAFNPFGLASGRPPIDRFTKPDTGLSPISRKMFGVQFKGTYPQSYTPVAAGLVGKTGSKPVINLPERGDYQDFRFRQFMESANTKGKFGFSIKSTRTEPKPPEETNPLGRRGKTPIKTSNLGEFTLSRAKVVEETTPRYQHEVYSAKGKPLSPSVVFGETKPIGALGKTESKTKSKPEINLEPRKDYQDFRFSKYLEKANTQGRFGFSVLSKTQKEKPDIVFNTGNKVPSPLVTNEKNYQQWRYSLWEKKNPPPEKIGSESFQKLVETKLPKQNQKAPVFSVNVREKKSNIGFRRTSKSLFEEKPKEKSKPEFEFKNVGSKSETVLLKPLTRRRIMTKQEQQQEYGYEFRPIPTTKSESGSSSLVTGIKVGSLIGIQSKQGTKSILDSLNKTLNMTKTRSSLNQKPKQINKLFTSTKQIQGPKQIPMMFTAPRQSQTPKQAQQLTPKFPTPQTTRQTLSPRQQQPQREALINLPKTPVPKPLTILKFVGNKRKDKRNGKSGPTGLYNLGVNNIFASSLNITVAKNRRYEF